MAPDKHNAELLIKRIGDSNARGENKKSIFDFCNEQLASGVKYGTLTNYLKILSRLAVHTDKPFKELTKAELVDFFMNLKPGISSIKAGKGREYFRDVKEYSPQTVARMQTNVKVFWHWLCKGDKNVERDEDGVAMAVSWIKANYRKVGFKYNKDVLNREEIEKLIRATRSTRTKAIIAVLFESGMRAGEFLGMKRSQLQLFDDYCEFICDGKTGKRPVVLVKSYPYLKKWLNELDSRKDIPKKFADEIWMTTDNFPGGTAHPMDIGVMRNVVQHTARKTDITKRVWVHGLRHSSATDFVKQGYNEAELRLKYGWTPRSDMPSNYTHYKHDELKSKILNKSGKLNTAQNFDGNTLPSKECPFCSVENPVDAEFCFKCGKPITVQKVKEAEKQVQTLETMQSIIGEMKKLEENGFSLQQFNSFMQNWSKSNNRGKG